MVKVAVDACSASPGGGVSYLREQLRRIDADIQPVIFARKSAAPSLKSAIVNSKIHIVSDRTWLRLIQQHLLLGPRSIAEGCVALYAPGSTMPLVSMLPTLLCIQNPHLFNEKGSNSRRHMILRGLAWWSVMRAHHVIHISETMSDQFKGCFLKVPPSSTVLSGAGALTESSDSRIVAPRHPYLLFVSNLYRYKRADLVVSAFAHDERLNRKFELVVVGEEMEPGVLHELETLAASSRDRVIFRGFIEGEELAGLYRNAACYINLSEAEAFPLTPAEALEFGTPIVLSNLPVFKELYGDVASFVEADSEIADVIRDATARPVDRLKREEWRADHSWAENGRRLSALLKETATHGVSPSRTLAARCGTQEMRSLFRLLRRSVDT